MKIDEYYEYFASKQSKIITNQELGLFFIGLAVCNLENITRASNTNRKLLRSRKNQIARLCRSEFFFYYLNIYYEKFRDPIYLPLV